MPAQHKVPAGSLFPTISWPTVNGGKVDIAGTPGWRMLVVYRGKHCPLCKKYFAALDGMLDGFAAAGVAVSAVSADPKEKVEADLAEERDDSFHATVLALDALE